MRVRAMPGVLGPACDRATHLQGVAARARQDPAAVLMDEQKLALGAAREGPATMLYPESSLMPAQ